MVDIRREDYGESPTIEVRIYEDAELIRTELCETAEEAAALAAHWEERPGVECEVRDLTSKGWDQPGDLEVVDVEELAPHDVAGGPEE